MASPAMEFALDQGLRVFPVSRRSKVPIIKAWPERATNDRALVEHWADVFPGCNWAALTGKLADDVSIDVDGERGRASLLCLPPLAPTLTVRTGRTDGGHQYHYRYPLGRFLRNSTGKIGLGIDVKAMNGVAVIPDSIHPKTGIVYSWEDARDRATLPDSWADLIEQDWQTRHAPPQNKNRSVERGNDLVEDSAVADHDVHHHGLRLLFPGCRNDGLTRFAGKLQRKGYSFEHIRDSLFAENIQRCHPPLPSDEVITIAESIRHYPAFDGLDPLDAAWSRLNFLSAATTAFKFRSLVVELQRSRPGLPVALPQERIGQLLGIDQQAVSRLCRRSVASGLLTKVSGHIIQERACTFLVTLESVEIVGTETPHSSRERQKRIRKA